MAFAAGRRNRLKSQKFACGTSSLRGSSGVHSCILVDANERYREVPCIKRTRACHRDVSQPDLSFLSVSEFETFLSEYEK